MNKVLVIGDSCTDVFIYGNMKRVCPEAPVPVFNPITTKTNGGMARNVLANLVVLGVEADIITNTNDIKKIRYIDDRSNQMVLRVDEHDYCDRIKDEEIVQLHKYDAIIISDYCKGFLIESDIEFICSHHKNVFVDTKKQLGDWIEGVSYIKINELEHEKNFDIIPNYPILQDKLIVTKGKDGCEYMGETFKVKEVPVKDVSGAGDTFLAGLVQNYITNGDIRSAIKFAQLCTEKVVQKHGVTTI